MAIVDTNPEFDTFAYARTLKAAGVEKKQAEACAEATRAIRAGLATKTDLDTGLGLLETRLNARLDARISGLETRMLRVAIAIVPAQTALTAALTAGLTFGLLRMFGGAP